MEFSYIREFNDDLKTEWKSLFDTGITKVPFLRPEYLKTWWQTRGGGEWPEAAQLVLISARQNGQLIGLAPCFVADYQGKRSLLFLGSIEISDYLDFVVKPQHVDAFVCDFVEYVKSTLAEPLHIEAIDLHNILESSPTISALQQAALTAGLNCEVTPITRAPYIPLDGDYEAYLNRLDKKQRHEMRRKVRRLMELSVPNDWYVAKDPQTIDSEIEDFLELMAFDSEKQAFLTPKMKEQMRVSMQEAFKAGILQLTFLRIGDRKAAAYLNFDFENRIYVYNSGIHPDFFEHSPGWVLLVHLLKWANENNRFAFDFMRGTEDYKYKFGAVDRQVMRVKIEL